MPSDSQLIRYAEILLDTCLGGVQPGWQVMIHTTPAARPLVEELSRQLARRGAYPLLRIGFDSTIVASAAWVEEAPLELLAQPSPIEEHAIRTCDAVIAIMAPENTRDATSIPAERIHALQAAYHPALERLFAFEAPWVGCQYPTPALAQEAGLSTDRFAELLFASCLLDWDAERARMARVASRFDAADEVRVVGAGTDLRLSTAGRRFEVDAGAANLPGGEFFCSPVEDSAEGVIHFGEFPAVYAGREVTGIRLRLEHGRVVEASADANEAFLHETLAADEGARRIGELGIGCNPGITQHMRNTLFDEKIDGTAHLALGSGFPHLGGTNDSAIHWDLVKDLRVPGSRIELDGEVVQRDGVWQI